MSSWIILLLIAIVFGVIQDLRRKARDSQSNRAPSAPRPVARPIHRQGERPTESPFSGPTISMDMPNRETGERRLVINRLEDVEGEPGRNSPLSTTLLEPHETVHTTVHETVHETVNPVHESVHESILLPIESVRLQKSNHRHGLINDSMSLKKAVVLMEVLGPPRSKKPFSWKRYR